MPKQKTLQRISDDIRGGNLGKARDRLHSLLAAYPEDLSLRPRLANVYQQLHHPGMAGRYWFLDARRTRDIENAVAEFKRECGGDPWIMLARLKLRIHPEEMPEGFAKNQIFELLEQCRKKYKRTPDLCTGRIPAHREKDTNRFMDSIFAVGCGLVVFVVFFLMVSGVIQVIRWFVNP